MFLFPKTPLLYIWLPECKTLSIVTLGGRGRRMEACCLCSSSSSPKPHLSFNISPNSSPFSARRHPLLVSFHPIPLKGLILSPSSRSSLQISPPFAVAEALEQAAETSASPRGASSSKVDKSGRFCSPRAARELAL